MVSHILKMALDVSAQAISVWGLASNQSNVVKSGPEFQLRTFYSSLSLNASYIFPLNVRMFKMHQAAISYAGFASTQLQFQWSNHVKSLCLMLKWLEMSTIFLYGGFQSMGVPPVILHFLGFSTISHRFWGTPMAMETIINHILTIY